MGDTMTNLQLEAIIAGPREVAATTAALLRNKIRTANDRIVQRGRATRDQERDLNDAILALDYELSTRVVLATV
jgi:hypothetical protein